MTIHLENMLEHDPAILLDVVAGIGHPAVDVCLDIGHVQANARVPVLRWIEVLGNNIGYVHLHDNHGAEDEHLGLGCGDAAGERGLRGAGEVRAGGALGD